MFLRQLAKYVPGALWAVAAQVSLGLPAHPVPGRDRPREIALIAVLSPVMARGPALVIALASRVVLTIGDLVSAALAAALTRRAGRAPALYAADRVAFPANNAENTTRMGGPPPAA
jgi:hypothetical protein